MVYLRARDETGGLDLEMRRESDLKIVYLLPWPVWLVDGFPGNAWGR